MRAAKGARGATAEPTSRGRCRLCRRGTPAVRLLPRRAGMPALRRARFAGHRNGFRGGAASLHRSRRPRIWNDGLRAGTLALGTDILIDHRSRAGIPQLPLPYLGNARSPADLVAAEPGCATPRSPDLLRRGRAGRDRQRARALTYHLWDPSLFFDSSHPDPPQSAHHLGSGLLRRPDGAHTRTDRRRHDHAVHWSSHSRPGVLRKRVATPSSPRWVMRSANRRRSAELRYTALST